MMEVLKLKAKGQVSATDVVFAVIVFVAMFAYMLSFWQLLIVENDGLADYYNMHHYANYVLDSIITKGSYNKLTYADLIDLNTMDYNEFKEHFKIGAEYYFYVESGYSKLIEKGERAKPNAKWKVNARRVVNYSNVPVLLYIEVYKP